MERTRRPHLEERDVRHDTSYDSDDLGIRVEQVTPVLPEDDTQRAVPTVSADSPRPPQKTRASHSPVDQRKPHAEEQTRPARPFGLPAASRAQQIPTPHRTRDTQ